MVINLIRIVSTICKIQNPLTIIILLPLAYLAEPVQHINRRVSSCTVGPHLTHNSMASLSLEEHSFKNPLKFAFCNFFSLAHLTSNTDHDLDLHRVCDSGGEQLVDYDLDLPWAGDDGGEQLVDQDLSWAGDVRGEQLVGNELDLS